MRRPHAAFGTRPAATAGRVSLYFTLRYFVPIAAMLGTAAGTTPIDSARLSILLTASLTATVALHALASARKGLGLPVVLSVSMIVDLVTVSALVAATGGIRGPLTFLYTMLAMSAGILLSSAAGLRMLLLATPAIVMTDVLTSTTPAGETPAGVGAVAALWILAGTATALSAFNERELARRSGELSMIARVTLDIEASLSLNDILANLCRGVVEGFRFDVAAVLVREGDDLRCLAGHGLAGAGHSSIPLRGVPAEVLAAGSERIVEREEARREPALHDLIGPRGYVALPLSEDCLLVATRFEQRRPAVVVADELEGLGNLARHARLAIANARLHEQVEQLARTDPLTSLANHGEFQRALSSELADVTRYETLRKAGHRPSLILLDIDRFKSLNDRYGHPFGDEVLKTVAGVAQSVVRSRDLVARYGGEEFAVVLRGTSEHEARATAERIRRAVAQTQILASDGRHVRVTVSAGIATAPAQGATPPELIDAADRALYRAKASGRNRVVHASDKRPPVGDVVRIEPTRRRRVEDARRAGAAETRAPEPSGLPKRRTPRA